MFFREVIHEDLGCASYVIADQGRAIVVDPKWEVEDYLEIASTNGFQVTHIIETHNHADHVSGRGRLVKLTGARVLVSGDAGVAYEHESLADGDVIELGDVAITVLSTPGHRPEHISLLVADKSRSEDPWLLLTGDSLFIGDLARPDLAVEPAEGARDLFRSLNRLMDLNDAVQVKPAHIGGSLCGGPGMSRATGSTVGYERRFNEYLQVRDESVFVDTVTSELSPQPPNFERIVELNRGPHLTETAVLEPLLPQQIRTLMDSGAVIVDGRSPREFDSVHIPDSFNVTMIQAGAGTRAAWMVDADAEIITIADGDEQARHLARLLEAVGFRNLHGYLSGGIRAWQSVGYEIETTPAIDVPTLASRIKNDEVILLDVRDEAEWASGHVPGSINVPYQKLRDGLPAEIRNLDEPLAVACSAGIRSSLAVSALKRKGHDNVEHVVDGGVPDLESAGVELVSER